MSELPIHLELPHERFIRFRLPSWIRNATSQQRSDLHKALIQCHRSAAKARDILDPLESLETFAEPLLEMDLRGDYPHLRDMQVATLSKRWHRDSVLWIPIYDISPEHSLLEAALLNFDTWETRSSGFGSGSAIYLTGRARGLKSNLLPEVFAQRCRQLDLGQRYLLRLNQVLSQTNPANEPLAPRNKHQRFVDHQRNCFDAVLQMAQLRGDISDNCARQLKYFLLPPGKSIGKLLLARRVRLLGQVLPGIIHFSADPDDDQGRCAVYFPGHREYPLKEYSSLLMFRTVFTAHLNSRDTRHLVSQLMPIDYRDPLLSTRLRSALSASHTTPVEVIGLSSRIEEDLFEDIHRQQMLHLVNDLGRLAPATAKVQAAQREKLLDDYHIAGLDLLTTLKHYIPSMKRRITEPVDILDAATLYQDIETWNPVERLAGSVHLLNIGETQASGQATPQMQTESSTLPPLVPVRVQGRTRLWKPEPDHYRVALRLPDGEWHTNALGSYDWADKTFLLLNQAYYEIRYNEVTRNWHIVSQREPRIYSPPLWHNGVGAWRMRHEDATQWPTARLIARLSARAAHLSEPQANALLTLGDARIQTLRQLHRHSRRTPPLLLDSLKRLWVLREIEHFNIDMSLDDTCRELCGSIQKHLPTLLPDLPRQAPLRVRERKARKSIQYSSGTRIVEIDEAQWMPELFDHLYQQLDQTDLPHNLHTRYPDLPASYREDLAFTLQTLGQPETTPPALEHELDRAWEQIRISRVFEGLYPGWPHSQHSEYLTFSLFESLEPWPENMRLEFIDTEVEPPAPVYSIGVKTRLNYRRLKKTAALYEIQDRQGKALSTHADFYDAIWQALPTQAQKALSQRHDISLAEDETAADLKRVLFGQASKLRTQTPAIRTLHRWPAPPMTATATPLPEPFAVPGRVISDLQLRDDGVYWNLNHKSTSARAYPHYILDKRRYYPVTWSPQGWRLLNAHNPYGFYQPRVQRKSKGDPRWTLHHPAQEPSLLVQADALPVPTRRTDQDVTQPSNFFTQDQLQRLRTPKSYRDNSNLPQAYDRVDNARYPLRDLDGQPMTITVLHYSKAQGSSQSLARARQLLPYLAEGVAVAQLYENKLRIRRFQEEHKQSEEEGHLVGRFHVAPKRALGPGELLGVYGGMLIPLIISHHRRDPFTTWVQDERSLELIRCHGSHPQLALPCLTGDNILSRINTRFEYQDGVAICQAASGYNVEAVAFPVDIRTADGGIETDRYHITALFTRQAVKADEELRMDHGYTWEQIQTLTSTQPMPQDDTGQS